MRTRNQIALIGVVSLAALVSALTLVLVTALPAGLVNAAPGSTIDFEGLAEGSTVSSVSSSSGISGDVVAGSIKVIGFNPSLAGNQAMIFDATCAGGPSSSITTTLPQFAQFLVGNRSAGGKATRLASA